MREINKAKMAIFGSTPVEELFIRRLKEEGVAVDSFQSSPNPMIRKSANDVIDLTQISESELVKRLKEYDIIHLSTDESIILNSDLLLENNISYIGGTRSQLEYESDKTKIFDAITENDILPETCVITSLDSMSKFEQDMVYVLKFVGDYTNFSDGNICTRVRPVDNIASKEAEDFIRNSLRTSGKALIQRNISGEDFSVNYFVDENLNFFNIGSNVCYKHLRESNTGPLCGGTGSYSIGGSLPFLNEKDLDQILDATKEFVNNINSKTEKKYTGPLNLDLIKERDTGKVYLLEVNCRRPGIDTSATLLGCLETSLYDIYRHTNNGTLNQLKSEFNQSASLAVSTFPSYYPYTEPSNLEIINFSKRPSDVQMYFGWIEIDNETEDEMQLRLHTSNSVVFVYSGKNLEEARKVIYEEIQNRVPTLKYRTDIGII